MDEYIFDNVAPQRKDIDYPWLMSAGRNLWDETWANTVEEWERIKAAAAEAGVNIMQTTEEHEARLEEEAQQPRVDYGPITEDIDTSAILSGKQRFMETKPQSYVPKITEDKPKKEMDLMEQAFLMSMMESMRGEDIGQAPAVVAGGGQRQWPSMMGQFAPWEQQKPYWWIA